MSLVELHLEKAAPYATLLLNRPEKLNALSNAMLDDFVGALEDANKAIAAGQIHGIVLRSSTPKAFCVGADLSERLKMNESEVSETLKKIRSAADGLAALTVPVIALIEGAAFGGGLELALACDIRIASMQASMGLTETRLAIIPGGGGTQRLTRLVGEARAKELIFTGRRLPAAEALSYGVVNMVSENAESTARVFIEEIIEGGPIALRAAKAAIEGGYGLPLAKALDLERDCYESCLKSEDRVEGLRAFSEKRKPVYKGK